MSKNYWNSYLYPLFLSTLSSCTLAAYTDIELQSELDLLAKRAVAKFKFPKTSLSYAEDITQADGVLKGYYFINDVAQKELNVIIAWMKVYWLEYQLSRERNYENSASDKDVKAFSSGNLISSIDKVYLHFIGVAEKEEYDYGRVNKEGKPAIGDING